MYCTDISLRPTKQESTVFKCIILVIVNDQLSGTGACFIVLGKVRMA